MKSWSSWKRWSRFLIPKNVTSERPIALMPTLIRCWEALRAFEVEKWKQKYRVDWDATDGRNGGAQQTVWEILLEMERIYFKAKEEDQGAVPWFLVLDLSKAFERVSLSVVWAWSTHFSFPRKILRVLCGYFELPLVPDVTDVPVSPSSVVAEFCDGFSCCSDWDFVEPQFFSFSKKRANCTVS